MALQGANGRGLEAPEDGTRLVILIDALDELPSWLGVFITTRPEVEICDCSRENHHRIDGSLGRSLLDDFWWSNPQPY